MAQVRSGGLPGTATYTFIDPPLFPVRWLRVYVTRSRPGLGDVRLAAVQAFGMPRAPERCPPPWTTVAQHCLRLFPQPRDWGAARAHCRAQHPAGHLAAARTLGAHEVLRALSGPARTVWLGASDYNAEGDWRWGDGSELVWDRPWAKNEPNDAGGRPYTRHRPRSFPLAEWARRMLSPEDLVGGEGEVLHTPPSPSLPPPRFSVLLPVHRRHIAT